MGKTLYMDLFEDLLRIHPLISWQVLRHPLRGEKGDQLLPSGLHKVRFGPIRQFAGPLVVEVVQPGALDELAVQLVASLFIKFLEDGLVLFPPMGS